MRVIRGVANEGVRTPTGLLLVVWAIAVAAYAFLKVTANFADLDEVLVGSRTYLFQAVLTDVEGHVQIGATAKETAPQAVTTARSKGPIRNPRPPRMSAAICAALQTTGAT